MHLSLQQPLWTVALCVLLGVAYAAGLYVLGRRRGDRPSESHRWQWIAAVLRGSAVSLLAFLLLTPLVKRTVSEEEKPIVVVAQDNSQSPFLCRDSALYRGEYAAQLSQVVNRLAHDYSLHSYTYGTEVVRQPDFAPAEGVEHSTDLSALLTSMREQYAGRNLAAVVLTGDGLYNRGSSPEHLAEAVGCPLFAVALGDTSVRCDAAVASVRCNKVAFLGSRFVMDVAVRASRLKGRTAQLSVECDGRVMHQQHVAYAADDDLQNISVEVDADKEGVHNYVVRLSVLDGETSSRNNVQQVVVEVVDGRQHVAIIAAAPHPDVAALQQSIGGHEGYEVETFLASTFKAKLSDFDLVVLHRLPALGMPGADLVRKVIEARVPVIMVLGTGVDLARFNNLGTGLQIVSRLQRTNEVTAQVNNSFTAFTLDDEVKQVFSELPPLVAPFGDYRVAPSVQTLFYARMGNVVSEQPLVCVGNVRGTRCAVVAGEGLWRWRLADYKLSGGHTNFDNWLNKLLVYTALQPDKERFHVETQRVWQSGEDVVVEAELYNDNYEPINVPDALLMLIDSSQHEVEFTFSRRASSYRLSMGQLPAGRYRYRASTTLGGQHYQCEGSFVVEALNLEDINLVANHGLMYSLSSLTGGTMLYPSEVQQLPDLIKSRVDAVTMLHAHTRYVELLRLPWVLALLVLLLGVEWVLRKYNGEI